MAINDILIRLSRLPLQSAKPRTGSRYLITNHLIIKPLLPEDVPYADEWTTNPRSYLYHSKKSFPKENLGQLVAALEKEYEKPETCFWTFHERLDILRDDQCVAPEAPLDENGKPLVRMYGTIPYSPYSAGVVYVNQTSCFGTNAELDFILGYRYWPTEHMPEVLSVVMDYLFYDMGLHRISVWMRVDNVPGSRMLKRLGFNMDGVMRELYPNFELEESWFDVRIFSMLPNDWERQKSLHRPYNLGY